MASSSSRSSQPVKFAVRIQRFLPFLGFHQLLMILIAIAIVLLCMYILIAPTGTTTNIFQLFS